MKIQVVGLLILSCAAALAQEPGVEEKLEAMQKRWPQADADRDGVLTLKEARAFNRQRRLRKEEQVKPDRPPAPTHADVKYGDHPQQAFDLWLAEPANGEETPLCIYIHGGGFRGGDKSRIAREAVELFLDNGISFVSMNYRLTEGGKYPYPIPMHDAVRGLQFIRCRAAQWNIDPEKIACYGGSAGAGISAWIAFHDDLADPTSDDPVARQSSRIVAAGMNAGQATYDMRVCREWFGVPDLPSHSAFTAFYDIEDGETFDTIRVAALAEDASPINHLTKDDPPLFMAFNRPAVEVTAETEQSVWVHHPLSGIKLKEAMDRLGIESVVTYPGHEQSDYENLYDFLIQKLK